MNSNLSSKTIRILGIETSCDETAVAIVDSNKKILAHQILSQADSFKIYGGVIPELAARSHLETIDHLIFQALNESKISFTEIDAFCATTGPGLIGGLIVGTTCAKALSAIHQKPFLAINHLEGHVLTARLFSEIPFPFLVLLVSGGHCQILSANGIGNYEKFGETIDDAVGETFDKIAQMLDLDYPGGPKIEKLASNGNPRAFKFTKPLIDNKNEQHRCDFSFSGLKTAARLKIEELKKLNSGSLGDEQKEDLCASLQFTISEILVDRLENVISELLSKNSNLPKNLVICGGVAANQFLLNKIKEWAKKHQIETISPPLKFCTDNAAMIAWAGIERFQIGLFDSLSSKNRARWSLEELKASSES